MTTLTKDNRDMADMERMYVSEIEVLRTALREAEETIAKLREKLFDFWGYE